MAAQSIFQNTNYSSLDPELHDALDQFPPIEAPIPSESSNHSNSTSNSTTTDAESTATVTPPSSATLRRRRPVKTTPDGSIDSNPHFSTSNSYKNVKLTENLNSETDSRSETTSVSEYEQVNAESTVNEESTTADSPVSEPDLVYTLAELIIDVICFQLNLLAVSIKLLIRLINNPYSVTSIWTVSYNHTIQLFSRLQYQLLNQLQKWLQMESFLKLCVRIGWGVLWLGYCLVVLVSLLVPALVLSGVVVKWIVEEPVMITEQLVFDYTKDSPVAFVPVVSCLELVSDSSLVSKQKSGIGSGYESRVVPFDHELMATVSLVMPESDYNRNLGVFQVRVDFLASDGNLLASTKKPCMLHFKSDPVRLLSTMVQLASLLTGYPSETQTLDIKFGYTEKHVPLSCSRVVIEQRAEFAKGGGVPEIYSAYFKLESQLPFLKRMLWYWKGLIYMWISGMVFTMELLFTLVCCAPVVFPWVRRRVGGSLISNASHNMPSHT